MRSLCSGELRNQVRRRSGFALLALFSVTALALVGKAAYRSSTNSTERTDSYHQTNPPKPDPGVQSNAQPPDDGDSLRTGHESRLDIGSSLRTTRSAVELWSMFKGSRDLLKREFDQIGPHAALDTAIRWIHTMDEDPEDRIRALVAIRALPFLSKASDHNREAALDLLYDILMDETEALARRTESLAALVGGIEYFPARDPETLVGYFPLVPNIRLIRFIDPDALMVAREDPLTSAGFIETAADSQRVLGVIRSFLAQDATAPDRVPRNMRSLLQASLAGLPSSDTLPTILGLLDDLGYLPAAPMLVMRASFDPDTRAELALRLTRSSIEGAREMDALSLVLETAPAYLDAPVGLDVISDLTMRANEASTRNGLDSRRLLSSVLDYLLTYQGSYASPIPRGGESANQQAWEAALTNAVGSYLAGNIGDDELRELAQKLSRLEDHTCAVILEGCAHYSVVNSSRLRELILR